MISCYQWDIQVSTCSRLLGMQTGLEIATILSPELLCWPPNGSTVLAVISLPLMSSGISILSRAASVIPSNISQKIALLCSKLQEGSHHLKLRPQTCLGPTRPRPFNLSSQRHSSHSAFSLPLSRAFADMRELRDFPLGGEGVGVIF